MAIKNPQKVAAELASTVAQAGGSVAPDDAADAPETSGKAGAPVGRKGRGWVVNKTQLMYMIGKPITSVERFIRDGAPVLKRGANGGEAWQCNTADFIAFMIQHSLEAAGVGSAEATYEVAKRRDKDAQAKMRELDYLERTGKMVDIENIRPRIREAFTTTRSRMLSVPSQIIGLTHAQQRQLEDAINDALAELSDPQTFNPKQANEPGRPDSVAQH